MTGPVERLYGCCRHCSCPVSDGHPVPCVKCEQPVRVTPDRLVARLMNREVLGGGVNAAHGHAAKDAPKDGHLSPSGVPAPPPAAVSWSHPPEPPSTPRRWWNPLAPAVRRG